MTSLRCLVGIHRWSFAVGPTPDHIKTSVYWITIIVITADIITDITMTTNLDDIPIIVVTMTST